MSTPPPRIPPKRPNLVPPPPKSQQSTSVVRFGAVGKKAGHRVSLYGPGGIGKTTLACLAEGKSAIVDADESLDVLSGQLEEMGIEIPVLIPASDFPSLRSNLQASGYDGIKNIILDTNTKIEEWCVAETVKTVRHPDKGTPVNSIEGYGFGKGFQFVFDKYLPLLADLDRHARAGRNVFLIMHECTSNVPNPNGEDWIRYEPRLQNPSSGKASIRLRVKEWCDHMLFFGYDVEVSKEGKAKGHGSRTLYTSEKPFCMAKSRTASSLESISIVHGDNPWPLIIK